jgi:hypothetical protein
MKKEIKIRQVKKENRKLKKENRKLLSELEAMQKEAIIYKNEFVMIPINLFDEMWDTYSKRPVKCEFLGKEVLYYNNENY